MYDSSRSSNYSTVSTRSCSCNRTTVHFLTYYRIVSHFTISSPIQRSKVCRHLRRNKHIARNHAVKRSRNHMIHTALYFHFHVCTVILQILCIEYSSSRFEMNIRTIVTAIEFIYTTPSIQVRITCGSCRNHHISTSPRRTVRPVAPVVPVGI